jgi:lysophospholipase L1-like esterase
MKVRRFGSGALTLALAAALAAFAPAAAVAKKKAKPKSTTRYYLALGDSLSQGIQPLGPSYAIVETNAGYPDQLYSYYSKEIKHLKLVDVGCPGDTTSSLLTGKGNSASVATFKCDLKGGSQLAAAVAFLKAHHNKGEVPLVTIDIGANDVDGCTSQTTVPAVEACVGNGVSSIKTNTPQILSALKKAAPKGTTFAAMNLYDPVLAYGLIPTSPLNSLAGLSLTLVQSINTTIATADTAAGFKTADVADAFDTYDTTDQLEYTGPLAPTGQMVAKNLYEICTLTWMCAASPQGPNIHANAAGYAAIAGAFETVIGKLH